MFKNENKGIVFKSCGMTWAMPLSFHLNNGRARVNIRSYNPGAL